MPDPPADPGEWLFYPCGDGMCFIFLLPYAFFFNRAPVFYPVKINGWQGGFLLMVLYLTRPF